MKNAFVIVYCIVTILLCCISDTFAQSLQTSQAASGWTTDNPFKTDVFVENFGQFNSWAKTSLPVKYAINNSDKIFFTKQGVVFKIEKIEQLSEEEKEQKVKKQGSEAGHDYFVNLNWFGCNPDPDIIVSEVSEAYYTFGEKGYENIKAKGFRKLLYKNLYPKIDVEFCIPEKGGIKYKIILHPGADPSLIKMQYSGDVVKIKKDKLGNIIIKTPAGNITDHAPESYYATDGKQISSNFLLRGKTVSFQLHNLISSDTSKIIVIDPWTSMPFSVQGLPLDIDYDVYGNVYFSGGTSPHKLTKYSMNGNVLWTFTNPPSNYIPVNNLWSFPYYYSKFCLIPNRGTSYIGEGWTGPNDSACRIMKINSNGMLTLTSPRFGANNEIYKILYNKCNNTLIAFGGGTHTSDNIKIIADTNLTASISKTFNGYACNNNDIVSAIMDYNGDFYALSTDALPNCTAIEGHLQKSLLSANYNPPCVFDVQTSYTFNEVNDFGNSISTVRGNVLALNNNYVFGYDGKTLKAWNKMNGNLMGSIIVNNSYMSGKQRTHEGIDADENNNVYVGGFNCVHVLTFNGSNFIVHNSITTNIPNEVRDVKLNKTLGKIYICGMGFVTEANAPIYCPVSTFSTSVTISNDSCLGNACVNVSGGLPPYSYVWSNGSTDSCSNGLPIGVYTVVVTDNSCVLNSRIDTVNVNSNITIVITPINPVICKGDTITLHVSSPGSGNMYQWNNGMNGNSISISPPISTTYKVIANNNLCTDSASVIVTVNFPVQTLLNPVICQGQSIQVGIQNYSISGNYIDTLSSSSGCDSIVFTNLTVNPVKLLSINPVICQGLSYQSGIHNYFLSGTYIDTLTTYLGCDSIITCNLTVNPKKFITIYPSICQGDSFQVGTHIYYNSGTFVDTLLTFPGCDSIITTVLNVNPQKQITINPVICQNNFFTVGTNHYTIAGIYQDTLHTFSGCDSIVTTNLTVNPNKMDTLNAVICLGRVYVVGNHNYSISGIYNDTLSTSLGCDSIITTNLTVNPLPVVNLGTNIQICEGEPIEIEVNSGYTSYLWHDGSTNNKIIVTQPGIYWVMVNYNNCFITDSISIDSCSKPIDIWIPNAFTPNGDGLNDVFKINTIGEISKFEMLIFNRWGQLIFESDEPKTGWDGKYLGKEVKSEVYTYKIFIKDGNNNQEKTYTGRVTLIR